MFNVCFKNACQDSIKVQGGRFFISRDNKIKDLKFTDDITNTTILVKEGVRNIAKLNDECIVCSPIGIDGEYDVFIYSYLKKKVVENKGMLISDDCLMYIHNNEMRWHKRGGCDGVMLNAKQLKDRGFVGEIEFFFEDFAIATQNDELVPNEYYNYDGTHLPDLKRLMTDLSILKYYNAFINTHRIENDFKRWFITLAKDRNFHFSVHHLRDCVSYSQLKEESKEIIIYQLIKMVEICMCEEYQKAFRQFMAMFTLAFLRFTERYRDPDCYDTEKCAENAQKMNTIRQEMYLKLGDVAELFFENKNYNDLLNDYEKFEKAIKIIIDFLNNKQ